MQKNIKLTAFKLIKFVQIKKRIFVLLKLEKSFFFFEIPPKVKLKKENDLLTFYIQENEGLSLNITSFFKLLDNLKNLICSVFRKKIILSGLGYKCIFKDNLSFKLGYSHNSIFDLETHIKNVSVKKENILLESTDRIFLGNFLEKIYLLKPCDTYKGKGFKIESKNKKLKEIKKK